MECEKRGEILKRDQPKVIRRSDCEYHYIMPEIRGTLELVVFLCGMAVLSDNYISSQLIYPVVFSTDYAMAKWRGVCDWLENRRPKYYGKGGSKTSCRC